MSVVKLTGYAEAVAALGDSEEVLASLAALLRFVEVQPDRGAWVEGAGVQVVSTRPQISFAPLTLYYKVFRGKVHLVDVCRYDELSNEAPLRHT